MSTGPTRWKAHACTDMTACATTGRASSRQSSRASRAWTSGTDGGRVALPVLLPAAHVVRGPGGPVDRLAVERIREMVEVDVPAGQHLRLVVLRQGNRGAEREVAAAPLVAQLPAKHAMDVRVVL